MIPSTVERVPGSTGQEINRRIAAETAGSARWHAARREFIDQRLDELGREWDIERTLEANASTLAFAGVVLSATVDRRWLVVPAIVTAFLFQHVAKKSAVELALQRVEGVRGVVNDLTVRTPAPQVSPAKRIGNVSDRKRDSAPFDRAARIVRSHRIARRTGTSVVSVQPATTDTGNPEEENHAAANPR